MLNFYLFSSIQLSLLKENIFQPIYAIYAVLKIEHNSIFLSGFATCWKITNQCIGTVIEIKIKNSIATLNE